MAGEQALDDFGIGEGGPLRRLETKVCLTSLRLQLLTAIAITWLPLVVFGVIEYLSDIEDPLILDPSVHVRLLIAAPVFLLLDRVFPPVCRSMLQQLCSQGFISDAARPKFDRILKSARRLADSSLPELVLLSLALCFGVLVLLRILPVSGIPRRTGLTPAQLWYALTDYPFFQFLLWRSIWRWAVWVRILFGLSRLDLVLVPTHPDRRGGISFLRLPSLGYCTLLLFAISSVLVAGWDHKFSLGASLMTFKPLFLLFGFVASVVAFGPLLVFAPKLLRIRVTGVFAYGALAALYGRIFGRRWLGGSERASGMLGTTDTQALSDLALTYRDTVDRIRSLLFDTRDLVLLLVATLFPMVPAMLAYVPREEWWKLVGLLTGGRLP